MNKLKKILSLMACFAMVMVSTFTLSACSKEEVAENTETVIETSSSIIPVELSKETAQGIYTTALQNLLRSQAYEIKFSAKESEAGQITVTEVGALNSKGQRFIYSHYKDYMRESFENFGYFNGKYCTLNLETKTYTEDSNPVYLILGSYVSIQNLFGSAVENIMSGRYYNGHYYVTFYSTDIETFFEILIKDDKIISAHGVSYSNNQITAYANYEFKYTDVDTSKVVMSLDGFTKAS